MLRRDPSEAWEDKNPRHKKFLVAMRFWVTPVLIPNTMVKT